MIERNFFFPRQNIHHNGKLSSLESPNSMTTASSNFNTIKSPSIECNFRKIVLFLL